MQKNEISQKVLREDAKEWIDKLLNTLILKDYGKGTKRNYVNEMILLFKYFNHKPVVDITQQDIEQYLLYIKNVHVVGRAKCRSVAQTCSFFYKHVLPSPYIVPSRFYPKKQFILPNVMSQKEVQQLLSAGLTLKEQCIIGLLYGCGMRISEVVSLEIHDIETPNRRIKIRQGKGAKDRYTLLPDELLIPLRKFYLEQNRPQRFLFTSPQTKGCYHVRSLQTTVNSAMHKAGFKGKDFTAHTLRHSFATHMLDNGNNIHVIKTLLGHSNIQTTMVYLHLQQQTQLSIISPLDALKRKNESND